MVQTMGGNQQNDIYLGADGNIVFLSSLQAVVAACKTACLTQLGECVLQTGIGLPNFQTIWVGVPDYAIWETYLQNTLLDVEGVTSVQSIRLAVSNNVLSFVAEIITQFGNALIASSLSPYPSSVTNWDQPGANWDNNQGIWLP
jgi:hypothetical protein